jgi:hypothetical protein
MTLKKKMEISKWTTLLNSSAAPSIASGIKNYW